MLNTNFLVELLHNILGNRQDSAQLLAQELYSLSKKSSRFPLVLFQKNVTKGFMVQFAMAGHSSDKILS